MSNILNHIPALIVGGIIGAFIMFWLMSAVRQLEKLAEKAEGDR